MVVDLVAMTVKMVLHEGDGVYVIGVIMMVRWCCVWLL